ncbi:unnamed protein product [Ceratitis capitata]|uniref:(Mediterranean fruit fly) hypothetical protein n=1 Tax=Ceratitis capitata TaxID=7213 RepID=A0A811VJE5_CERCA|nr:unnamed protein product [Ceratitis capitata]
MMKKKTKTSFVLYRFSVNQQPLQQHQHQHQQQHQHTSMHSNTQLQKLRQQYPHINTNNNNNNNNSNSTNKNNYHHHQQQQPQPYNNNVSSTHGNALPVQQTQQQQQQPTQKQTTHVSHHTSRQQSSSHQQQQQQQQNHLHHQQQTQPQQHSVQQLQQPHQQHKHTVTQMPPQQSHGHTKHHHHQQQQQQSQQQQPPPIQTTVSIAKNVVVGGHPQQQQQPPQPLPPTQHLQQQPPTTVTYYTAGNVQANNNNNNSSSSKSNNNNVPKPRYNNNNNNHNHHNVGGAGMPPKIILQNPHRVLKARQQNNVSSNSEGNTSVAATVGIGETKKIAKSSTSNAGGGNNAVTTSSETSITSNIAGNINQDPKENSVVAMQTAQDMSKSVHAIKQVDASSKDANKENVTNETPNSNIIDEVSSTTTSNILSNEDSTVPKNSKEKTPMCLVNELARYNKITHQYRLTNEKGPAHCKRFTVTLKLGEEEYSADGFKIKKAQHLAAAEAIEKTKYKHPVPKMMRRNADGNSQSSRANITPTVELNALAMKLGQQTYYLLDPRQATSPESMGPPTPDIMMQARFNVPPPPPPHALPPHGMPGGGHLVAQHPPPHVRMMDAPGFVRRNGPYAVPPPPPPMHGHPAAGLGMRPRYGAPAQRGYLPKYNQQQRYPLMPPPPPPPLGGVLHNGMIPPPPMSHPQHQHHGPLPLRYGMPAALTKVTLVVGKQKFVGLGRTLQQAKHDAAARALQVLKAQATTQMNEDLNNSLEESDNKSPISLVHEIGIQRSMMVHFKVLREEGPAHMKKFVTACVVGSIVTEGEGNGKKTSKKRAAEKMLEELKKLPPLTPTKSPIKRIKVKTPSKATAADEATPNGGAKANERGKRSSGSIKEKNESDSDVNNPITRLIQLQQNRKEKEPVFEMIAKSGNENSRRRDFIIEVTANGKVARGAANSKKLAKRKAAQNLLLILGEKDNEVTELATTTAQTNTQTVSGEPTPLASTTAGIENTNTVLPPFSEVGETVAATIPTATPAETRLDVPLVSTTAGQVPGILILRHNKKHATKKKESMLSANTLPVVEEIEVPQTEATIGATTQNVSTAQVLQSACVNVVDKQVTMSGSVKPLSAEPLMTVPMASSNASNVISGSNSNATATNNCSAPKPKPAGVNMKDQLLYLAKLLGFEVNFSDFPKANHSEYLTIVTLSSNPPQICHGMGTNAEESQDDAAKNALKLLSELGLNNAAK